MLATAKHNTHATTLSFRDSQLSQAPNARERARLQRPESIVEQPPHSERRPFTGSTGSFRMHLASLGRGPSTVVVNKSTNRQCCDPTTAITCTPRRPPTRAVHRQRWTRHPYQLTLRWCLGINHGRSNVPGYNRALDRISFRVTLTRLQDSLQQVEVYAAAVPERPMLRCTNNQTTHHDSSDCNRRRKPVTT